MEFLLQSLQILAGRHARDSGIRDPNVLVCKMLSAECWEPVKSSVGGTHLKHIISGSRQWNELMVSNAWNLITHSCNRFAGLCALQALIAFVNTSFIDCLCCGLTSFSFLLDSFMLQSSSLLLVCFTYLHSLRSMPARCSTVQSPEFSCKDPSSKPHNKYFANYHFSVNLE